MKLVGGKEKPPAVVEFTWEEADALARFLIDEVAWEEHKDVPLPELWTILSDHTGQSY